MSATRETRGRACGKVILVGEHAVVYGVPAIAVGVDRGATAVARPLLVGPSRLRVRTWGIDVAADDAERDLARAFRALLEASRVAGPLEVEAEADLPPGAGLGCSAALGVAVARAVDPAASDEAIIARAMEWERVFHGNPSGVDAAVATLGGSVLFERGLPPAPLPIGAPLVLAVGHSGMASSTRSMVESVARQRARRPEVVDKTFEGVRAVVNNARLAIEAGDLFALGKLLDMNQMLLAGLLLSTQEIEQMCGLARAAGALGAKLTGAGGGGSVVALVESRAAAQGVLAAWERAGFSGFIAEAGPAAPRERAAGGAERASP